MKYYVEVTRIGYARQTLEIDAISVEEAKHLAMTRAPDEAFSTYDAEYEVSSVRRLRSPECALTI
ncbi:hypothetical protein [Steroidobacter sp.]|uniref:hypothetical protein n=1 Tax=Steroidobacter sp. TaxID=1978227 RepID=UPI001A4D9073|nr:hypothetical protein [Steroidobacter sp.]MBL8269744.1 hypothetical protein [Steroidobacter sp.]